MPVGGQGNFGGAKTGLVLLMFRGCCVSASADQYETGFALGDELFAYWRGLPRAAEQGLPRRDSLNPADIKSLLPNVFLMEWIDHDHVIIRLRGTWLDERVERPRANYNLFEQYSEKHSEAYKDFVEAMVRQPCAAALRRQRVNEIGRSFCYHTAYFPLIPPVKAARPGEKQDTAEQDMRMFFLGSAWLEPLDHERVAEDSPILYEGAKIIGFTWLDIGSGVPVGPFFSEE